MNNDKILDDDMQLMKDRKPVRDEKEIRISDCISKILKDKYPEDKDRIFISRVFGFWT